MATAPTDLVFIYTNHRGETAERRVVPEAVRFASTQWHREPQWLLVAYDLDRGERRDFAWKNIRFGGATNSVETPAEGQRGDTGRFGRYTNEALAGQCRMQARESLDPDLEAFMYAVAARLTPEPMPGRDGSAT